MSSNTIPIWNIPGGIHPPENKLQSVGTPIQAAPLPAQLVLPLSQHIGAPAKPVVAVGDKVLKGQMIARATGEVSVPVHASSSGTVIAIEDRTVPHASGMSAPCIIIATDGKDEWISHQGVADYRHATIDELIAIIRNAGVAGMGGAGFPSAVKLKPKNRVETLILNGAECEPYITADDMLMRERANEVIQGTLILQHILQPAMQTLIGVEDNKPQAIAALRKAAEGTNIHIVSIPTKYPSGGKKQITQILTGKEVPTGKSSNDIGVFCQNVGTAAAIYRAVVQGEPLISRITTITGNALQKQQNYEVLLGTPISTLLQASAYQEQPHAPLIMGGSLMGVALSSTDIPVIKTTNCIIAPGQDELPAPPPAQACIRCGYCAEACPVKLLPQQMYWFAQAKNHKALQEHHLFDCIECGACAYVCPSSIPLVQYYRAAKADIRKADAEHKKADHARERFEARESRLQRLEEEKEARRKERQQAAESAPAMDAEAIIAAAQTRAAQQVRAAQTATNARPTNTTTPIASTTETETVMDDPVQAAMARAKAKAAEKAAQAATAEAIDDPVQAALDRVKAKRDVARNSSEQQLVQQPIQQPETPIPNTDKESGE